MTVIEVVDYDPVWPDDFWQERALMLQVLEHAHLGIHHIGGTSVPGIASRPIVDILIEVTHLDVFDALNHKVAAIGYSSCDEISIPGGRLFQKVRPQSEYRVFAYQVGDARVARHLALRDYLRGDAVLAAEYGAFKQELAQEHQYHLHQYTAKKADYLAAVESAAFNALFPVVA